MRKAKPMSWTKCGLNGPVSETPGTASYQWEPAASITSPFSRVGIARIAAIRRRMGTSCGQDEAGGADVTAPAKEISGPFGPKLALGRLRSGLNFALGKLDKTR